MVFVNDELRASSDKWERLVEKRYGGVRAFDTFIMVFYRLFSTIRVHVAPTLRYAHGDVTYSVDMLYLKIMELNIVKKFQP